MKTTANGKLHGTRDGERIVADRMPLTWDASRKVWYPTPLPEPTEDELCPNGCCLVEDCCCE